MAHAPLSFARLSTLLAEVLMLPAAALSPASLLVDELGVQSIDLVELVEAIEEERGTRMGALDLGGIETLGALHGALCAALGDELDVVENIDEQVVCGVGGDGAARAVTDPAAAVRAALAAWMPDDPMAGVDTLVAMVHRRGALSPDRVAVTHQGRDLRCGQLSARVEAVARSLRAAGVGEGDRVVLVMPNGLDFFCAVYAVQQLRAVAVPLAHAPRPDRIARVARHCGARLVLSQRPFARPVRLRLVRALGDAPARLCHLDGLPVVAPEAAGPLPCPRPDDLAMLQYTSGTTGAAKGVMLTHGALLANLRQAIPTAAFTPDDVFVSWLPVYHDMGLIMMTMCPLYLGARLVLLPVRLQADNWLSALAVHGGTVTAAPDFAYRFVLRTGGALGGYDLSRLRVALVAAEPVRAHTIARFEAALGIPGVMRPGYGLAESCVAVTFVRGGVAVTTDAEGFVDCGGPVPGTELSIRDPEGRPLPPGARGEVCLRSPSQTVGYFRNPEATRALFTADGFVRTGDVGHLSAAGTLTIVDRIKHIIIVGGRNTSPKELEEVADTVPGVSLAMAVGVDRGGDAGEQVQVVVETPARAVDPEQERAVGRAVRRALQDRLGVRAQQVFVVAAGTIPRTPNGKLRHRVMQQRILRTGQATA